MEEEGWGEKERQGDRERERGCHEMRLG